MNTSRPRAFFRKTNRYSKFNYDFTRPKIVALDSGISDELLNKLNDGDSKVHLFVQYNSDDRDEYDELLEDMINEKLRKLWIEENAQNLNCADKNEEEKDSISSRVNNEEKAFDELEDNVDDDSYLFEDFY
jgi:hypothetical protein